MDPTPEQPTPTPDPNTTVPGPTQPEASSLPQEDQIIEDRLRGFIEGELRGSVKSKAFCDIADLADISRRTGDSNEEIADHYKLSEAIIFETIRQRSNEIQDYGQYVSDLTMMRIQLETSLIGKGEALDIYEKESREETARNQAADLLLAVKADYTHSVDSERQRPPPVSTSPPNQPAPSA